MGKYCISILISSLAFALGAIDDFEAKRAEILARPRRMMIDNDGNDFVYYSTKREISEEAFIASRIAEVGKTRAETLIYCPWSAGFGNFSVAGIGTTYTNECPWPNSYNPIKKFQAKGLDPLQMAINYCRREKREIFLGLRWNDTHDASSEQLFSDWKRAHPEVLFGTKEHCPPRGAWSAVDFEAPIVREYMKDFLRKFLVRYDLDGVEYDFFRHFQMFKSVAWGDRPDNAYASAAQLDLLSRFMHELRMICDEEGRRKGKPIVVAIRVPDSFEFCRAAGVDLERWLREKSVDIVIIGGYYQLNPWQDTIARIHALGAKALVSLDESRVGMNKSAYRYGILPGRNGANPFAFYAARLANAAAQGADGVCFFNCHGKFMEKIGAVDQCATEGINKKYFAIERGQGGYEQRQALLNGDRDFAKMPDLDPWNPHVMHAGDAYAFELSVGDDFKAAEARGLKAEAYAMVLLDTPPERHLADLRLEVNGADLGAAKYAFKESLGGVYRFAVPTALLRRGMNRMELKLPRSSDNREYHFADFLLEVKCDIIATN